MTQQWASEIGKKLHQARIDENLKESIQALSILDRTSISDLTEQALRYVEATGHREPSYWDGSKNNQSNQPVVCVDWNDATAYAEYVGKRLPREKEWEWAARGSLVGKEYPWGDQEPSSSRANYGKNVGKPTPVGSYPANGYELHDMAGNVAEWCQDWYSSDQRYRVLRGGSWNNPTTTLRVAYRLNYSPPSGHDDLGFRCVADLP